MDKLEADKRLMTDLKCPYCDLKKSVHIPDEASPEEIKMLKTCPCGKAMETKQEAKARMKKRGVRKKSFYTMMYAHKPVVKREKGIEFTKCGITLYAYQADVDYPMCYIIDPETGLSIQTVYHALDVVYRHVSYTKIKELKRWKSEEKEKYAERKKAFEKAKSEVTK